jgi:hypothetical protein
MQVVRTPPSNLLLWFSILAGPSAWAAHLSIEYFLTTAECQLSAGNMAPWMAGSTAALFVLTFAGLIAGLVARREASHAAAADSTEARRRLFMANCGILLSVLFIAGIVLATIPILVLEPCRVGP